MCDQLLPSWAPVVGDTEFVMMPHLACWKGPRPYTGQQACCCRPLGWGSKCSISSLVSRSPVPFLLNPSFTPYPGASPLPKIPLHRRSRHAPLGHSPPGLPVTCLCIFRVLCVTLPHSFIFLWCWPQISGLSSSYLLLCTLYSLLTVTLDNLLSCCGPRIAHLQNQDKKNRTSFIKLCRD